MKKFWTTHAWGDLERETASSGLTVYLGHLEHGDTCAARRWLQPMLARLQEEPPPENEKEESP